MGARRARRNKGSIMPKIEILAPVGSEEMLRAAVFSGADAVYLAFRASMPAQGPEILMRTA